MLGGAVFGLLGTKAEEPSFRDLDEYKVNNDHSDQRQEERCRERSKSEHIVER